MSGGRERDNTAQVSPGERRGEHPLALTSDQGPGAPDSLETRCPVTSVPGDQVSTARDKSVTLTTSHIGSSPDNVLMSDTEKHT